VGGRTTAISRSGASLRFVSDPLPICCRRQEHTAPPTAGGVTTHTGGQPMAGQSSVDRAEMQKAAGQIDEALGTISGIQRTLGSNVQGLMATWKGNAATAFLDRKSTRLNSSHVS